jgi:hypothetical protein
MGDKGGGGSVPSPFVSLTRNPDAVANSPDLTLRAVATGEEVFGESFAADTLSRFRVPVRRTISPNTQDAQNDEEVLFLGEDLVNFLVESEPNPYLQK